jgi:hypothetical protein
LDDADDRVTRITEPRSVGVNATLLSAVAMVIVWIVLVFGLQTPSGWVHVPYVAAVLLFARRILIGAPRFLS